MNRECTAWGIPDLGQVSRKNISFEYRINFSDNHSRDQVREIMALYKFPPDVETAVVARDNHRCRFTGPTDDTVLCWIFPPAFSFDQPEEPVLVSLFDKKPYIVAANVITLRKELKVHLHSSNFAVDVDDNFRIVVHREMGSAQQLLPTHLPRHPRHDERTDVFLRKHFCYSLNLTLLGGDVRERYSPNVILSMMEELGVGDPDSDMVPLNDPRWHTVLGEAIWADVLRVKTIRSVYEAEGRSERNGDSDSQVDM
ncbi:hypothetical protein B0H10DRAFT_508165 [Mycena sp. CBHHK59/15]|nr:hypothetical protein B0H10DRAFT_508165 [Mycena sp. CBHHK59/15]